MEFPQIRARLQKRSKYRTIGLGGVVAGTLVLLDSPYPFPVPVTGIISVILSLVIYVISSVYLYRGLKLPIKEALLFIEHKGGKVQFVDLLRFLQGEGGKQGRQLLHVLEKKDLAGLVSHDLESVERLAAKNQPIPEQQIVLFSRGKSLLSRKWHEK